MRQRVGEASRRVRTVARRKTRTAAAGGPQPSTSARKHRRRANLCSNDGTSHSCGNWSATASPTAPARQPAGQAHAPVPGAGAGVLPGGRDRRGRDHPRRRGLGEMRRRLRGPAARRLPAPRPRAPHPRPPGGPAADTRRRHPPSLAPHPRDGVNSACPAGQIGKSVARVQAAAGPGAIGAPPPPGRRRSRHGPGAGSVHSLAGRSGQRRRRGGRRSVGDPQRKAAPRGSRKRRPKR